MQLSEEDRSRPRHSGKKVPSLVPIVGVLVLLGAGGYWWFSKPEQATPPPITDIDETPVATPEPQPEPAPEVDIPAPPPMAVEQKPALPSLDNSDDWAKKELGTLSDQPLFNEWIGRDQLIRRLVSFLDGLSRGAILNKILPINGADGKFIVDQQDDVIRLSPRNYERYNNAVAVVTNMDMAEVADRFHLMRPLLEKAITELGYPATQLDDKLIQSIDLLLKTQIPDNPPLLVADSVNYKFANPNLEKMTDLQKQLVRMGPAHSAAIKQKLRELRDQLLAPESNQ